MKSTQKKNQTGSMNPYWQQGMQDRAVDIHHLESRGMGGSKNKDYIENLMGLCRDCHNKAESDSMFNMFCKIKHLELVCHQIYAMIEYNKTMKRYENRK